MQFRSMLLYLGILTSCASCSDTQSKKQSWVVDISNTDSKWIIKGIVPGTQIYYRELLLGELPFTLSTDLTDRLGIPFPSRVPETDGWRGGIRLSTDSNSEIEFLLRVPDTDADQYQTVETPWGRRNSVDIIDYEGNTITVNAHDRIKNGVLFQVSVANSHITRRDEKIALELRCENLGNTTYYGKDPYMFILWGTYEVPWTRRNMHEENLTEEWQRLHPGDVLQHTVFLETPNVNGNFCVWAVLDINDEESSFRNDAFFGISNKVMFRVRIPNCPPRCCKDS